MAGNVASQEPQSSRWAFNGCNRQRCLVYRAYESKTTAGVCREDFMTEAAVKHDYTAPNGGHQSPWLAMSVPWTTPYISPEHTDLLHGVV